MTEGPAVTVQNQVEGMRQKLLDLSLRNRMLNYRPSKRLSLTVLGEHAGEVHRIIMDEGKKMTFVGRPDPPKFDKANAELPGFDDEVALRQARADAEEELDGFLGNPVLPVDQTDTKLNVEDYETPLQAKLRAIHREAHLAEEELGINTLFLTLGMLEWNEVEDRSLRAPLLFVPVQLVRQANGSMKLEHAGSDVGGNLPLKAKLREFGVDLPEFDDEKGVLAYFEEVTSAVRRLNSWTVHPDEICVGFFNYEKYAMYMDLGGESWPANRKPWMDEDLIAMLGSGYSSPESPVGDETFMDDVRPVSECHEVYDADSSQTLAMVRAASGLSVVIEGPPGTGKSQTITNIIAEAVAQGKTVLFVSAKRAALDVVKRRLHEAGLGAMCLDMHDKMTNRREFYAEIKRTANLSLSVKEEEEKVARLTELRDKLNAHSRAVNEPMPDSGITPFQAMVNMARLPQEKPEDREGRIAYEELKAWSDAEVRRRLPLVQSMQERIAAIGVPSEHPFWGAEIDYLDPARKLDLTEDLSSALTTLERAQASFTIAAQALKISIAGTTENVRLLQTCVQRAISAPPHDGVAVNLQSWDSDAALVRSVVANLRTRADIRARRDSHVTSEAWQTDLTAARNAYVNHAGKWYRFLIGEFRSAKSQLQPLLTSSAPAAPLEQRDLLRDLVAYQNAGKEIDAQSAGMQRLFGVQWRGLNSDPSTIEHLLNWVLDLHAEAGAGRIPKGLLDFFVGSHESRELESFAAQAQKDSTAALDAYKQAAGHLSYPTEAADSETFESLRSRVERWSGALDRLPDFISYNGSRQKALAEGLDAVVRVADTWPLAGERLGDAYLRSYYSGALREAMQSRPSLREFERVAHEAAIEEFRSLDEFKLKYNRAQVRLAHFRRLPNFDIAVGNLQQLKIQCELQRRQKPIRWIMARAGEAIQRIKPVFMMSPLSVSIHLPPELPLFDLVIFDEASQIRPEDALSSIIRAKQSVVVGDTRQMPPTSFFDRIADDEEIEDEEMDDAAELGIEARKVESILSLMSAVTTGRVRRPDLRWHYRSIHPALIQPSNEMFYENRLIVFPSAGGTMLGRKIGVQFHHHPDSVYEGGAQKRINRREAELVADAVVRHLRATPQDSLMVAAMNKPQADLIYNELLKREQREPELFSAFRERHPHEPLDVKNLENVQGDERDVVFISITYGRDAEGKIRQQFGPLLRDGGERRLNVLISRARRRCEVFSNLSADDLKDEGGRPGVTALKRYLRFAQTGELTVRQATSLQEDSTALYEDIASVLESRGYELEPNVGSEGFRIDMAVRDQKSPDRYVLGIQWDGPTYHSARSARDRDKLREGVLEKRGWRLHQIWSHDWWQDRQGEIDRLLKALDAADEPEPEPEVVEEPPKVEVSVVETERQEGAATPIRPYVEAPGPRAGMGEQALVMYLGQLVKVEGPVHEDLLMLRLKEAAGNPRLTAANKAWMDDIVAAAMRSGSIRKAADAFVTDESQMRFPRDWSNRPAKEKKASFVSEVELAAALFLIVQSSFGVTEEEAIKRAFGLMGFKRLTDDAAERGQGLVNRLVAAGRLSRKGAELHLG